MAMYVHTTIKVRPGKFAEYCAVMTEVRNAVEAKGWKLLGAYATMIGRIHEMVHLWEVQDGNHCVTVFAGLYDLPNWPDLEKRLAETVEEEVLKMMVLAPYAHQAAE